MSSYPYLFLFSSTLIYSSILALSSSHWLMIWASLELNMISFIPLIILSSWSSEAEASVKYFLFQALGSSLLLLSSFTSFLPLILPVALMMKLGMAPFHFWFPSVMNSISWPLCFSLSTWQKIAPLSILLTSSSPTPLFLGIASFNALVGGLGGLNQTQIRPLLAYSSIGHMGWMLAASSFSPWISVFYFIIYSFHSAILFFYFWAFNSVSLKTFSASISANSVMVLMTALMLLSLGGLPPLMGFIPKWMALSLFSNPSTPFILILGSLINIFYYLNITLASLLGKHYNFSAGQMALSWTPVFMFLLTSLPVLFL